MALVIKDRVRQTSTTAGTGTITLTGSVTGYQDFLVIGNGNTTYYTIADQSGSNWEVGLGTYTSPNQLARTTVYESSNANALVNFGSNIKDVFVTLPAEAVPTNGISGSGTTNYVPKFTSSGAIGDSLIQSYATQVFVNGTEGSGYNFALTTPTSAYGYQHTDGTRAFGTYVDADGVWVGADSNDPLILMQANSEAMRIDTAQNVGIGTTTPTAKLDVNGDIKGTTITANTAINLPAFVNPGTTGILEMVDDGFGTDILNIYTWDGSTAGKVYFLGGAYAAGLFSSNGYAGYGDGTNSGYVYVYKPDNSASIKITAPTTLSTYYTLTLPPAAGSANQVLKTDGTGVTNWVTQGVQGTAPVTVTAATYTVAATDQWIIGNRAGTITLTLPTASASTGRSLNIKTIQAQTVVSASSNVVPLNGGAAGTAILAATIGKYATLVSDGTNWIIMGAN